MRDDINVGDEVEVVVLRSENDEGHPVLSKARADYKRLWRELSQAKIDQTNLEGTVTEQVKGGLILDLGVRAFIPARYVDTRNKGDLGRFVGRSIPVKILEIDEKRSKVIASHVAASAEERKAREAAAWSNIEKDKVIEGIVQRITDFGAFIDLGGVDGLLHIREMSWGRVDHPSQVVKRGQKLEVLVLDIDESTKPRRIALGLKQLQPDPWKKAARTYRPGQMVTGKVTRIVTSCAFVELEEGIEAIIPISEMSEQRIKSPEEVLQVGQEIEARIKQVEPGNAAFRSASKRRCRKKNAAKRVARFGKSTSVAATMKCVWAMFSDRLCAPPKSVAKNVNARPPTAPQPVSALCKLPKKKKAIGKSRIDEVVVDEAAEATGETSAEENTKTKLKKTSTAIRCPALCKKTRKAIICRMLAMPERLSLMKSLVTKPIPGRVRQPKFVYSV